MPLGANCSAAGVDGPSPGFALLVVGSAILGVLLLGCIALGLLGLLRGAAAPWLLIADFQARYAPLRTAPRELWLIYVLKLLESYGYFSFSIILVLFLSEEFELSDSAAGWAYGAFGMLTTVYGLCVGILVDNLGVRRSLLLGSSLLVLARTMALVTTSITTIYVVLFLVMPLGTALGIPVLTTAIKRYVPSAADGRAVAFGLFYAFMNVAALVSGPVADVLRGAFGCGAVLFGRQLSPYRLLILTGVATSVLQLALSGFVREIEVKPGGGGPTTFRPRTGAPWTIAREICRTARFWRFLLLVVLLVAARLIFRHLDATLPKYLLRTHGPEVPYGLIYAINPAMIIVLVPLVSAYTQSAPPLRMIRWGAAVTAASPFWLAVSSSLPAAVLFVVTLSMGEACYSPRIYEYTTMVAPKGREGTYMALSSAPLFVAKLLAGGMSGALLETFCPAEPFGCAGGRTLWLIVGLVTATSPVLLFACSRCIQPPGGDTTSAAEDGDDVELRAADSAAGAQAHAATGAHPAADASTTRCGAGGSKDS
jgi:dipeptide/tripeptide permease